MLTRRKKTRPWLKGKNEGVKLLAQITQVFDETSSLEETVQQLAKCISDHVHSVGNGVYLYDREKEWFSLQFSFGNDEVLRQHSRLTFQDFQQCGIHPMEFGMIAISTSQSELPNQHELLQSCIEHTIASLAYIPLIANETPYGMFLFASKYLHHITEEGRDFFRIATQHIRLATEKSLLIERFEHEVASKVSQLQASEEKYRVLFEDASDAIVSVDFKTRRFLESNRQTEVLLGYSKDELLTMAVTDLWVHKDEKRLVRNLLRSVKTHRFVKFQDRQVCRKDGSFIWLDINASAVKYHEKHVALAIIRDVSQRKQVDSEKEVIEAINKALISSHNAKDVYRTVSQELLKCFTFDRMDIVLPGSHAGTARIFVSVQQHNNTILSDEREFFCEDSPIENVFRKGIPEIVQYNKHKAHKCLSEIFGKNLQASLVFPLIFEDEVIGVLHFGSQQSEAFSPKHFDFLQQIATQIAMTIDNILLFHTVNEERAVYKHLIENVNEIVFQADPRGKILFVNHRVKDILGYTPEEIAGTNFFACVIPEDLEEAKAAFRLTLRHEKPLSGEYRVFHKNGTVLTISIYTRPIFEDGRSVGMQGIIQDITPSADRLTTPRKGLHELIGRSRKMQEIYDLIMSVAKTDSTVLIHGESGTGKELIAHAIHASSHRQDKPFIVVNCAAYSEHLLESELFGHERGSFTGAHRRKLGRFELAKGGTIFIDEIGEIPPHSQLLLLRVLQNKTFERVGGEKTLEIEVRIIAATNKRLEEEIKAGRFREDLYYRLNVIPIEVPPLRERKDDIPHLVDHFRKKYSNTTGKQVLNCSQSALELLMRYNWYGNVRELENTIERAVVMATGPVITPTDLPAKLQQGPEVFDDKQVTEVNPTSLYDYEKQFILKTLQATKWNKYQTAKILGITRSTLYSKIQKYALKAQKA